MKDYLTIENFIKGNPGRKKSDGSTLYVCPRCKGQDKLEVHASRPVWYCHKCGVGGRLRSDKRDTVQEEWEEVGGKISEFLPIPSLSGDGFPHIDYLLERVKTVKRVAELRPHFGPEPLVVYLPVYMPGEEKPVYFIGRGLFTKYYWNPRIGETPYRKSEVVWGLHRINRPGTHVVLCEGIFDAVWEKKRLSLLGKTISNAQCCLIGGLYPKKVTLFLDGDAKVASMRLADRLKGFVDCPIYSASIPFDTDPDELQEEGERYVGRAERIL